MKILNYVFSSHNIYKRWTLLVNIKLKISKENIINEGWVLKHDKEHFLKIWQKWMCRFLDKIRTLCTKEHLLGVLHIVMRLLIYSLILSKWIYVSVNSYSSGHQIFKRDAICDTSETVALGKQHMINNQGRRSDHDMSSEFLHT